MIRYFRKNALTEAKISQILAKWNGPAIEAGNIKTETCFYVEIDGELTPGNESKLIWLLAETFEPQNFGESSFILSSPTIFETGPRLNFETTYSSTAVSICHSCGIEEVVRIEKSLRIGVLISLDEEQLEDLMSLFYDRMTEIVYVEPLESFESGLEPEPVQIVPLIEEGTDALHNINVELGLSMDQTDVQFYHDLFVNSLKRNPTDVELFEIGNANSEHSRHLRFVGNSVIGGKLMSESLMDIIKTPYKINPANTILAFDSSAIEGTEVMVLIPSDPLGPSPYFKINSVFHATFTAETHNHPTGNDPYDGAATGSGGMFRDLLDPGIGGTISIGGAGYCVGNLHIPGYKLSWEEDKWVYPETLASPLEILIRASDGASDYHNCIGIPAILGFTRSFGQVTPDGQYWSWFKTLMFALGAGHIDDLHVKENIVEKGMLVLQLGGPSFKIGLGGAAGSSMLAGENSQELDFNSVQRGDPEMEQRVCRTILACIRFGKNNPISSIIDYGAGGSSNAIPELVNPAGALINLRDIPSGDKSLSARDIWGNESQERMGILIRPDRLSEIEQMCKRENVPCAVIGEITGDGNIVVFDEEDNSYPVNLPLDKILGEIPPKTFEMERIEPILEPLILPEDLTVFETLDKVLRSISVGSKKFLTKKADRSVGGCVAQQQCIGPNHITLSDYAIYARSMLELSGTVNTIGEQPIKSLISPQASINMSVGEMILNMAGARITNFNDIKCLANWMLAAKLPGEGAWLYDASCALRDIMLKLGIAIMGGKDSLSMAVKTTNPQGEEHTVKAPRSVVISGIAPMDDITQKVTADLKKPGNKLLFLDLANGKNRLGSSALAQVHNQIGNDCPNMEDVDLLKRAFEAVQMLIDKKLISAIHDRSDGGLIVTLLEMAFAGNVGLDISIKSNSETIETLFSEELGLVLESDNAEEIVKLLNDLGIPVKVIGSVGNYGGKIKVRHNNELVLDEEMTTLRQIWEATSTAIDMLQANPECVKEEAQVNAELITPPPYKLTFKPKTTPDNILNSSNKPKVAIIREEGSNGDEEMAMAFNLAGFEVWDVAITDIIEGRITLDQFRGIAFVGGFTFGDVLDAGKGWAGVIKFNPEAKKQFDGFYNRPDTFSFGVCNGCQLMALLGWIPWQGIPDEKQPRFINNKSGRFESRFPTVEIQPSPAIMFKGMESSILGVWSAHAEGQLFVPDKQMLDEIVENSLAPVVFVDMDGEPTEIYPFNPNSSPFGIAGLCSKDGRHLAMMPHAERSFLLWQLPWIPEEWKSLEASPWLRMFQNAFEWCKQEENIK